MKRGRKSAAELGIKPTSRQPVPIAPPLSLGSDAVSIWEATIAAMPEGWFGLGDVHTLAAYCAHAATAEMLSNEIARFDANAPDWLNNPAYEGAGIKRLNELTRLRERETRAMIAAARVLRIAKSSRTRHETATTAGRRPPAGLAKPWR